MKKKYKYLLSLASGLLLAAGWTPHGFPFLLFVAFVPLLVVENEHFISKDKNHSFGIFIYAFVAFFIWNTLSCWWIYNAAFVGLAAAVLINSTFMGIVIWLFHVVRRRWTFNKYGHIAFIAFWITFEFLHSRWDLNWPHMNLGHGFGAYPQVIQWYEYTGFFGGTLWILVGNVLVFTLAYHIFMCKEHYKLYKKRLIATLAWIIIPVFVSLLIFNTYKEKKNPLNIVVVQPNLDPYTQQYTLEPTAVAEKMMHMAFEKVDSTTKLILLPESAIQEYVYETDFDFSPSIKLMRGYLKKTPQIQIVAGMSSIKLFKKGEKLSNTARKMTDSEQYYDGYNTALLISSDSANYQKYHKSKLVAGVEQTPFISHFKFLEKYALDFGGIVGSIGKDSIPAIFTLKNGVKISPVICFESSFGEYVAKFIRRGAQAIVVITNEGWWGNTSGHRQFLYNTAIRAIETRRCIARSANTGTSCFINQRGEVQQPTLYWTQDVIKQNINLNDKITFYVRYGDYIGRFFLFFSAFFAVFILFDFFKTK